MKQLPILSLYLGLAFMLAGSSSASAQQLPDDFPELFSVKTGETGEGFVLLSISTAPEPGAEHYGFYVMMVDDDAVPVKYRKLPGDHEDSHNYAYDFKVQPNGLTSFAQFLHGSHDYTGGGDCIHMIMDEEMNYVDSIQLGNGYTAEAHDFQLLPNGHALAFGYYLTQMDLSDVVDGGYPNAMVSGGVVQELDADKNVVWQWRTWDHYTKYTNAWGRRTSGQTVSTHHLNTINLDYDDNILLGTPTWTKKLNRQTGEIMWHLGGSENEFSFVGVDSTDGVGHVTGHAFYLLENGNYLVYDNGRRSTSQAHEYKLDQENKIAERIRTFVPDTAITGWHRGNAQRLPNGNTLVGWGGGYGELNPTCTEFDSAGNEVFKLWFSNPQVESYRAVRFPYPPSHRDSAVIEGLANGNTYDLFKVDGNDTLDIGIRLRVNDLITVGYSELYFTTYEYAPRFPTFSGRAPMVLPMKVIMEKFSVNHLAGEVSFDAVMHGIDNPEDITVYHRPADGTGDFVPLTTTYNGVTGMIKAEFEATTGEFIFTYPDVEHVAYSPRPVIPEPGAMVNYQKTLDMEWAPRGFYNSFSLQVARDSSFTDLVLDSTGMRHTILDLAAQPVNDTLFWRVKSHNDAGESDWSDTAWFVPMAPYVKMTSPVGSEILTMGLEYFIQWEDNLDEDVVLELYHNGEVQETIDTVKSNNAYLWEVPLGLDSACGYHIRISSAADPAINDVGPVSFSLNDSSCSNSAVAYLKVLAPNGGETYETGDEITVAWENTSGETVDIELYEGDAAVAEVGTALSGGETSWTVPNDITSGTRYRMVVSLTGGESLSDASNADFAIEQEVIEGLSGHHSGSAGLKVYPNPTGGLLHMEIETSDLADVEILIYNLQGQEVEHLHVNNPGTPLVSVSHNMDNHPAGTYLVRFVSGKRSGSQLITIK